MPFRCTTCAYRSAKWMGFCPQCRAETPLADEPDRRPGRTGRVVPLAAGGPGPDRLRSGIDELDRVLGGGFVPGSVVLLGGEPGVGKSTLLLQAALGGDDRVLYVSAEESVEQLSMRAARLGGAAGGPAVMADQDVDVVIEASARHRSALLIVDSIQAVTAAEVDGMAGGVAQVRETAARLVRHSKESGTATVLVGHITKDGGIAGPKLLEHMVDAVLYLEGETDEGIRVLRSFKNRFGPTSHVGLFEMSGGGLRQIVDPSAALVAGWDGSVPGTVVFPTMAGRRPLLVEVQALVAGSALTQPRRSVKGIEAARVHQLLAVLDRHAGLSFAGLDVYVGAAGGVKVRDPACDAPLALALASSLLDEPVGRLAAWGEIGLTGELRPAAHGARRADEAARLGLPRGLAAGPDGPTDVAGLLEAAGLLAGRSATASSPAVVRSAEHVQPVPSVAPRHPSQAGSRH